MTPPPELTVRLGNPEDLDAALAVWREARSARPGGHPPSPEREAQIRGNAQKPDAFLIVASDQSAIVGMALAMQGLADDGAGPPIPGLCFIGMVFVAPARWGQGIGGSIVAALLAEARSRGYDRTQLWTHATNLRAQRLYERHGFHRSGREQDHEHGERIVQYECAL